MITRKRLYHRIIVLLLSISMIIGLPSGYIGQIIASDSQGLSMTDISGHWANSQISTWLEKGLIGGYPDKTFKPDDLITRAEFMALVNRAYGFVKKAAVDFADVTENDWFFNDVSKALAAGYIAGYGDGKAGPKDHITRQEAAVIVSRVLDLAEYESKSAIEAFKDHDSISGWSREAVNSVVIHGYMIGGPDGSFAPARHITRAETVVVLSRAAGEIYNKAGTYEKAQIIKGNATINTSGVTLANVVVEGNLYLTPGVGEGTVVLKNVTVKGKTIVAGGGENSIILEDCSLNELYIEREDGRVRVAANGSTTIRIVVIDEGAILDGSLLDEDGNIAIVYIMAGDVVELYGDFDTVYIENGDAVVNINGGTVDNLIITDSASGTVLHLSDDCTINNMQIDAPSTITGQGTVWSATISSDAQGTTFEKMPVSTQGTAGIPAVPPGPVIVVPVTINIPDISGVSVPETGNSPVDAIIQTTQYTGTVTWSPVHNTFQAETVYTATITLSAKTGYTFTGTAQNFFTVAGASIVSNNANSGIITAVFPATVKLPEKSEYDILFDPSGITAGLAAAVDITLLAVDIKDEGHERVRVNVAVTSKPASSTVTLVGNYGAGPVEVIALGYWGPEEGHAVSKDYDMTYGLTANFSHPGDYTFSIQLHDMIGGTDIMTKTVTVTVSGIGPLMGTLTLTGDNISSVPSPGTLVAGTQVTVSVDPDPGKQVATFTVNGVDRKAELLAVPVNQYTFSMILSTNVSVTYENIPSGSNPPVLTADSTGNYIKTDLYITFTDDAVWRSNVTAVKAEGSTLAQGTQYELSEGRLRLKTNEIPLLQLADDYIISIESDGYQTASVTQYVITGLLGRGTLSDPFLVGSAQELDKVRHYTDVPGLYFKQTADIDLSAFSSFVPIGAGDVFGEEDRFMADYDGDNYFIENLTIRDDSNTVKYGSGLFGSTYGARLLNIRLAGVDIDVPNTSRVGALAGYTDDTQITGCIVENSTIVKGFQSVGGLVGHAYQSTVTNSRADVLVVGGSFNSIRANDIGGFVGNSNNSTITASSSHGVVSGVAGVGGFAGRADYGLISGCYADGNVSGQADSNDVGGFAGFNYYALIEKCYYIGNVGGDDDVGGFIGRNIGSIRNCYSVGTVSHTGTNAGGFAGRIQKGANLTGSEQLPLIENCYSDVVISGSTSRTGAFLGYRDETLVYGSLSMSGNYYNNDKVSVTQGTNAVMLSEEDIKKAVSFAQWDFINIWGIRENIAPPHLLWQEFSDNADLSMLSVSSGTLTPAFTASTISYTVSADVDVEAIDVIAVKSEQNAMMTLNDNYLANAVPTPIDLGPAGTDTAISVKVTAENGISTKTYTIVVSRQASQSTTYTLTYIAGSNGSIEGNISQIVLEGTDGVPVTAVADTGYEFYGWSDSSTANPRTDTNITSDKTVTAYFSLLGEDPPDFSEGYPQIYSYTDEGFRVAAQTDKISTIYFVVVADGSDAPTSLEVRAMRNYGSVSVLRSGVFMTYVPGQAYGSAAMLGLSADTDYDVYVVAEASGGTLQQSPVKLDARTLARQYPVFFRIVIGQGTFPRIDNITGTTLDISAGFNNKPGKIYYALVPEGAVAPDAQQIIDGFDYGNVIIAANGVIPVSSSGQVYTHTVTGLTPETAYDIYLLAADSSIPMIINPDIEKLMVATTAADEPLFYEGSPYIYPQYEDGFKVGAGIDKPGIIYAIVVEKDAAPPTSAQVKASADYRSVSVLYRGSVEAPDTQELYEIVNARGLLPDTEYDVYVVAEDMNSPANIQPSPTKLETQTLPYFETAPNMSAGYPDTVDVSANGARISVKTSRNAYLYYMVVRYSPEIRNEEVVLGRYIHMNFDRWRQESITGMIQTQRDEEYIIEIDGLDSGTLYTVYFTAVNVYNGYYYDGLVSSNHKKTFTTTGSTTPSASFSIEDNTITETSFNANVSFPTSTDATVFYMVVPNGNKRPTSEQVLAGGDYDGVIPQSFGYFNISAGNLHVILLQPANSYDVYMVIRDDDLPGIYTRTPYLLEVSTLGVQAPVYTQSPLVENIRDTHFSLKVGINKNGTIYYMLVPVNSTAPTSAQVKAGAGYSSVSVIKTGSIQAEAAKTHLVQLTGLQPDTEYDLYVVAEADGLLQQTPVKRVVNTLLPYIPEFFGSSPSVSYVTGGGFDVYVRLNQNGSAHTLVVPQGQAVPTSAQVKSPALYSGNVSAYGSINDIKASTTAYTTITGLDPDTSYDIYIIAEGASGGLSTEPVKRTATTLERISFISEPTVTDLRYYRFSIEGELNRRADVHFILLPVGSQQPTAGQVKAGIDYGSVEVVSSGSRDNIKYFSSSITGLEANKTYELYLVIEEAYGQLQAPIKVTVTTPAVPDIAYSTKAMATPRAYVSSSYIGTKILVALNRPGVIYVARFTEGNTPAHQEVIDKANSGSFGFTEQITEPDTVYTIIKDWNMTTFALFIVTSDTEVPVSYILPSVQEITILTE